MTDHRPVALITGVSSGIGHETALLLTASGFRVFGTTRDGRAAAGLPGVRVIRLDVTDEVSVQDAVQLVVREAGRIDALVNNAGYGLTGGLEETSVAEARQQFDTNFFGVLRMVGAVLPDMRRRRSGRIVNISSVLGFLPAPYMGIYAATKHAVEGYTETLDHEVRQFGIRAMLVQPSFTSTNFGHNGRSAAGLLDAYAVQREKVVEIIRRNVANGSDPRTVAEAVHRALTARAPRPRYPVGETRRLRLLRRLVPERLFDASFRKRFNLADGRD